MEAEYFCSTNNAELIRKNLRTSTYHHKGECSSNNYFGKFAHGGRQNSVGYWYDAVTSSRWQIDASKGLYTAESGWCLTWNSFAFQPDIKNELKCCIFFRVEIIIIRLESITTTKVETVRQLIFYNQSS